MPEKPVDYFKYTVYTKDRSKCSPSVFADGEFYHKEKGVYGNKTGIFISYQGCFLIKSGIFNILIFPKVFYNSPIRV